MPKCASDRTGATRSWGCGSWVVAGDGIHWSWRNVLNLDEVDWLGDHRLETSVVFLAIEYLATAMEALKQIVPSRAPVPVAKNGLTFEVRNVSINAALVIPTSEAANERAVELHTTMSSRELSTTTGQDRSLVWVS